MSYLKSIGATALALLVWLGPTGFVMWKMGDEVKFWHDNYQYHKSRNEYLFDGANARGLLDICVGPEGRAGVFYKEDCLR